MKTKTNASRVGITILALLAGGLQVHGATVFTTNELMTVRGGDVLLGTGASLGFQFNATVTSMIELDEAASTIRVYGQIPESTVTVSRLLEIDQFVGYGPPIFPNPPAPIFRSGILSVSATITIPEVNFDTGIETSTWNGTYWVFNGAISSTVTAAIEITHSLTTGGEVFSGTDQFVVDYGVTNGTRAIDASNYPIGLSLIPKLHFGIIGYDDVTTLADISATNGFELDLYYTPEPSSAAMFLLSGLCLLGRRSRH